MHAPKLPPADQVPAGHRAAALVIAPAGQYLPLTGLQTCPMHADELAPGRPYEPAGQSGQEAAPVVLENDPAAHGMHATNPAALKLPGPQTPEHAEVDKPTVSPYVPPARVTNGSGGGGGKNINWLLLLFAYKSSIKLASHLGRASTTLRRR